MRGVPGEFENPRTLSISAPKRRGTGKPQEKLGRNLPDSSKFQKSKQRLRGCLQAAFVATLSSWGPPWFVQ